jgi:hypothetical protein
LDGDGEVRRFVDQDACAAANSNVLGRKALKTAAGEEYGAVLCETERRGPRGNGRENQGARACLEKWLDPFETAVAECDGVAQRDLIQIGLRLAGN